MKRLKPFLSLAVGFLACVTMIGCAGGVPHNGPSALNIALFTVNDGVIGISYKFLLVASGGVHPYTWTISSGQLPPGLSLNSDGVISGTPTQLGKFSFTAKVTDSQSPTQAYDTLSTSITINPVLSLTSTTLPTGLVGGNYSATITASNGLQPYTYTPVPPDGTALPPGLKLVTTPGQNGAPNVATISGIPTSAGVYNFTVQVNDAASEVATAIFTITVVGRLQGPYVLYFNGFDNDLPFYDIAQLVASGDVSGVGVINGTLDQIGPGSSTTATIAVTGTYNIGQGTNFGTLTVTRSDNHASLNFKMIVEGSTNGDTKLILSDPDAPHAYGSGLLKVQSATTLNGGVVNYSFGLFGNDSSGGRYAGVGMFAVGALSGGSQQVTGGEEDLNDAGTPQSNLSITTGAVTQPDVNTGRGTYQLTTSAGAQNYVYYVVSPTELVALDNDAAGPAALVDVQQQQLGGAHGLFTNGSLKGQSLIELDGIASGNLPSAAVGVATFDGAGNIARTDGVSGYYTDQSDGGNLSTVQYATGTYNVDPTCGPIQQTCGRVTVNLTGAATQPVWYLVSSNQGFALDTNAGVTYGTLQPQSVPTGGFTIAALLGSYLGVTITPVLPSVANELDVAITPCCGGIWDQKYDAVGQYGQVNQALFSGAYDCGATAPACDTTGTALGRFEVTGPGTASNKISIIYVIGSASGVTGAKGGLVGLNVGQQSDGSPDPDPRITEYTR